MKIISFYSALESRVYVTFASRDLKLLATDRDSGFTINF